jgi:cellobiose dehydrogenase (acceptor)
MVTTNPTSYIVTVAEHAAAKILALGPSTPEPAKAYEQCGGKGFTGSTTCVAKYKCVVLQEYYSQCVPV